ncbi:MAG: hypothetical protein R3A11_04350 [Bdellovibrionota bacterium]
MKPTIRWLMVVAIVLASGVLQAQSSDRILIQGKARIYGQNLAAAKQAAIENALISAMEKKSYELTNQQILVNNAELLRLKLSENSSIFVKDYSLTDEKQINPFYLVQVNVQLKTSLLMQRLSQWGFSGKRTRNTNFFVVDFSSSEAIQKSSYNSMKENLAHALRGLGVGATSSGNVSSSMILISARLLQEQEKSVQVSVSFADAQRKLLDQFSAFYKKPDKPELLYGLIASDILEKSDSLANQNAGQGSQYDLAITGLPNASAYQNFRQYLFSKSNLFSSVEEKQLAYQKIVLGVSFHGNSQGLSDILSGIELGAFRTRVKSIEGQTITIELVQSASIR